MMNKHISVKRFITLLLTVSLLIACFSFLFTEAAAETDDGKIMVSLGDSYSSGEGNEDFYGQNKSPQEKINDPDWLAHRSKEAWSAKLKLPGANGTTVTMGESRNKNWFFAAASGATTEHMQNSQKKEYDIKLSGLKGTKYLDRQLDIFEELGDRKADYVTATIGGNDVDFVNVVTEAAIGSTYFNTNSLTNKINGIWEEYYSSGGSRDQILRAYRDISEAAGPQAHIIIAGYPPLLDPNGGGIPFCKEEAEIINTAVSQFNMSLKNLVEIAQSENIDIHFVSVEEKFKGHEAYSKDSYLNEIMMPAKSQDIVYPDFLSSYSMHPNKDGQQVYADCVQKKIDDIEAGKITPAGSSELEVVLALDVSGSMDGTPLSETKKAAVNFIDTVLDENASIGVVTYDNTAYVKSGFSTNKKLLKKTVNDIDSGGSTNIESGLQMASNMFKNSIAKKKIIVLMSDGEPNVGKTGDELVEYANTIKDDNIYIYTLGFFEELGSDKSSAQELMEQIASDGCHYEVSDADDLVFFFGDIADQISGQKYIYIRIACPVDVTVTQNGQTLCSKADDLNTRTEFGSLTFEESKDASDTEKDNRIKVLRLKDGTDYDVRIEGNGRGRMNYTIGFMDDTGEYSDLRKFTNIKISKNTVIDTVASNTPSSVLKVDDNGDGKYDLTYKAKANSLGKQVDYTYLYYIGGGMIVLILLLAVTLIIKKKIKNKSKGE